MMIVCDEIRHRVFHEKHKFSLSSFSSTRASYMFRENDHFWQILGPVVPLFLSLSLSLYLSLFLSVPPSLFLSLYLPLNLSLALTFSPSPLSFSLPLPLLLSCSQFLFLTLLSLTLCLFLSITSSLSLYLSRRSLTCTSQAPRNAGMVFAKDEATFGSSFQHFLSSFARLKWHCCQCAAQSQECGQQSVFQPWGPKLNLSAAICGQLQVAHDTPFSFAIRVADTGQCTEAPYRYIPPNPNTHKSKSGLIRSFVEIIRCISHVLKLHA